MEKNSYSLPLVRIEQYTTEFSYINHKERSFKTLQSSQNSTQIFDALYTLRRVAARSIVVSSWLQKIGSPSERLRQSNATSVNMMPTVSHLRCSPVTDKQNSRAVVLRCRRRDMGFSVFSQIFSDITRRSFFPLNSHLPQWLLMPDVIILTIGSIKTIPLANENFHHVSEQMKAFFLWTKTVHTYPLVDKA